MGLSALMLMGAGVAEAGSLIGTSITVSAAAVTPDGSFRYVENANGITIKKFIGSETEAIIPESAAVGVIEIFNCSIYIILCRNQL